MMKQKLQAVLETRFGKTLETADKAEIFTASLYITKEKLEKRPLIQGGAGTEHGSGHLRGGADLRLHQPHHPRQGVGEVGQNVAD